MFIVCLFCNCLPRLFVFLICFVPFFFLYVSSQVTHLIFLQFQFVCNERSCCCLETVISPTEQKCIRIRKIFVYSRSPVSGRIPNFIHIHTHKVSQLLQLYTASKTVRRRGINTSASRLSRCSRSSTVNFICAWV